MSLRLKMILGCVEEPGEIPAGSGAAPRRPHRGHDGSMSGAGHGVRRDRGHPSHPHPNRRAERAGGNRDGCGGRTSPSVQPPGGNRPGRCPGAPNGRRAGGAVYPRVRTRALLSKSERARRPRGVSRGTRVGGGVGGRERDWPRNATGRAVVCCADRMSAGMSVSASGGEESASRLIRMSSWSARLGAGRTQGRGCTKSLQYGLKAPSSRRAGAWAEPPGWRGPCGWRLRTTRRRPPASGGPTGTPEWSRRGATPRTPPGAGTDRPGLPGSGSGRCCRR